MTVASSVSPNVGSAGNIVLVAMRDIEPGEELPTDYAFFDSPPSTYLRARFHATR